MAQPPTQPGVTVGGFFSKDRTCKYGFGVPRLAALTVMAFTVAPSLCGRASWFSTAETLSVASDLASSASAAASSQVRPRSQRRLESSLGHHHGSSSSCFCHRPPQLTWAASGAQSAAGGRSGARGCRRAHTKSGWRRWLTRRLRQRWCRWGSRRTCAVADG